MQVIITRNVSWLKLFIILQDTRVPEGTPRSPRKEDIIRQRVTLGKSDFHLRIFFGVIVKSLSALEDLHFFLDVFISVFFYICKIEVDLSYLKAVV